MKKSIFYFLILSASVSFAQDAKYTKAMEKSIAIIDSAKAVSAWQEAGMYLNESVQLIQGSGCHYIIRHIAR